MSGLRFAFAGLAAAIVAGPVHAAERIALVIGNAAYEQTGWALANADDDARLIADALDGAGFDVETVIDADKAAFEDAVRRFGRRLAGADGEPIAFFYFAGHGVQSQGLNYLLPIDVDAQVEADIWSQAPRAGLVTQYMASAGAAASFFVLDACRDNPLPSAARSAAGRGLAPIGRSRGVLYAYSTEPGRTAADGDGANGPYAEALANLIAAPGLPAELMFKRVAERVEAATNQTQTPFYESGLRGADFFFTAGVADPASAELAALRAELEALRAAKAAEETAASLEEAAAVVAPAPGVEDPDFTEGRAQTLARFAHQAWRDLAQVLAEDRNYEAEITVANRASHEDFIFFTGEESDIGPVMTARIDAMAPRLQSILDQDPHLLVQVASGCDEDERRNTICSKRGVALRKALLERGLPADRMRGATTQWSRRTLMAGETEAQQRQINRYAWARLIDAPRRN